MARPLCAMFVSDLCSIWPHHRTPLAGRRSRRRPDVAAGHTGAAPASPVHLPLDGLATFEICIRPAIDPANRGTRTREQVAIMAKGAFRHVGGRAKAR